MEQTIRRRVSVSDADDELYSCPICLDLLTNAVITQCGHTFCESCLQGSGVHRCPVCKANIFNSPLVPNFKLRDMVATRIVRCLWCNHHTEALGTIEQSHEATCHMRPPRCQNVGCGYMGADLHQHMQRGCLHRTVECELCHDRMAACRLQRHRATVCPKQQQQQHRLPKVFVPIATGGGDVRALAVLGDGNTLAITTVKTISMDTAELTVQHWRDRGCTRSITTTLKGTWGPSVAMAVLGDGETVVYEGSNSKLRLWRSDASFEELHGHVNSVWDIVALPNDTTTTMASASEDSTIRIWVGTTCKYILYGHVGPVYSLAVLPGTATLVSGGRDESLRVWHRGPGGYSCRHELYGHGGSVLCLAALEDGRTVVSGSDDHTLRVWDCVKGECVQTLLGHTEAVCALAVLGDGRTVVSGSQDKTLRVWRVCKNEEYVCHEPPLTGHTDIIWSLAVMGDGCTVVSGGDDKTVRVWRVY